MWAEDYYSAFPLTNNAWHLSNQVFLMPQPSQTSPASTPSRSLLPGPLLGLMAVLQSSATRSRRRTGIRSVGHVQPVRQSTKCSIRCVSWQKAESTSSELRQRTKQELDHSVTLQALWSQRVHSVSDDSCNFIFGSIYNVFCDCHW